ncbi:helix-turn-helix domain-containing protein [Humitalea sp. 24SJ18S-53]|uniref:helix-turn-helix domain-containing protein n=1 Tax=Humitalea sp. 24SJ18S-53 TaxID=3422307 RepID=UPI003D667B99
MSAARNGASNWRVEYASLAMRLCRARAAAKLRQADVAQRVGISLRQFARLEAAEVDPTARVLFAWAHAVGQRINMTDMACAPAEDAAP